MSLFNGVPERSACLFETNGVPPTRLLPCLCPVARELACARPPYPPYPRFSAYLPYVPIPVVLPVLMHACAQETSVDTLDSSRLERCQRWRD